MSVTEEGAEFDLGPSPTTCPCVEAVEVVWTRFVFEEVLIPVVGSAGLLGNLATILILNR